MGGRLDGRISAGMEGCVECLMKKMSGKGVIQKIKMWKKPALLYKMS